MNFIANQNKTTTQVKNKLLASGALSDEVLVAAIERKPEALPASAIMEVSATQVPLSLKVLTNIEHSPVLKDYKHQIFAANANTPTYVKARDLEGQITNLKGDNLLLKSELPRTKLRQGKSINRGDVSNDPSERMLLSRDYATSNQPDSVRIILNQLQNDSTLNATEKQNFITYMNAIADILDSNQTIYTTSNAVIHNIQPVAATNTGMSANANTVLKERKLAHHHYFIADLPANINQRMANLFDNGEKETKTQFSNTGSFKLFPNPNKGNFKIELSELADTESLITVTITNLLGQTLFTKAVNYTNAAIEISEQNMGTGIYIVRLMQSNKTIGQSKLIIE